VQVSSKCNTEDSKKLTKSGTVGLMLSIVRSQSSILEGKPVPISVSVRNPIFLFSYFTWDNDELNMFEPE
jgi:hypothetical protein